MEKFNEMKEYVTHFYSDIDSATIAWYEEYFSNPQQFLRTQYGFRPLSIALWSTVTFSPLPTTLIPQNTVKNASTLEIHTKTSEQPTCMADYEQGMLVAFKDLAVYNHFLIEQIQQVISETNNPWEVHEQLLVKLYNQDWSGEWRETSVEHLVPSKDLIYKGFSLTKKRKLDKRDNAKNKLAIVNKNSCFINFMVYSWSKFAIFWF